MSKPSLALTLALAVAAPVAPGCKHEVPAGGELDDATKRMRDDLDPAGPAERAGEKFDRASMARRTGRQV